MLPDRHSGERCASVRRRRKRRYHRPTAWRASHDCHAAGLLALGLADLLAEDAVHDQDIKPQMPIILGAGGVIMDWAGLPLPDARGFDTVLISANAGLHRAALAILRVD